MNSKCSPIHLEELEAKSAICHTEKSHSILHIPLLGSVITALDSEGTRKRSCLANGPVLPTEASSVDLVFIVFKAEVLMFPRENPDLPGLNSVMNGLAIQIQ